MPNNSKEYEQYILVDTTIDSIRTRVLRNAQFQASKGTTPELPTAAHRLYASLGMEGTKIASGEGRIDDKTKEGILGRKNEIEQWIRKHGSYEDETFAYPEWSRSGILFATEQVVSPDGLIRFLYVYADDTKRNIFMSLTLSPDNKYNLEFDFIVPDSEAEGTYQSGRIKPIDEMTDQDGVIILYYLSELQNQLSAKEAEVQRAEDKKIKPFRNFVSGIEGLDKL